ncbi:hypothetical protein B0H19DRAFT_1175381 [Mycena capillaripes]|nr:hypothetical protein B0H19DRAFT_1175381 [Mycena capillaripes]
MERVRQKRPRKPPACDTCKARRVLCHPQPNGAPCPRCAEKNIVCTTSPVIRGRPRRSAEPDSSMRAPESTQQSRAQQLAVSRWLVQASASSSITLLSPGVYSTLPECPDLTPELVAHLFDCFDQFSFVYNPIINMASIKTTIRAVSFQMHLLPPQSRALAMCILAVSSIISFHEVILGPGPRPNSFSDMNFFSSQTNVRGCGARRAPACRALYAAALKAAWETEIMVQVSTENAASCFLIDLLEQTSDFTGSSRPWASASMSHIRALAPSWQITITPPYSAHWCGFLMAEALLSTRNRKPLLITHEDQLLLCGHEFPTAEEFLVSLETSSKKPGAELLVRAMKPYMFHITRLARQLWTTITGDHLRLMPLSESAVLQFLSALSLTYAILSHMLACADTVLAASGPAPQIAFVLDYKSEGSSLVRGCAFGSIIGFTELVIPFYRVLKLRVDEGDIAPHARERMRLLLTQTHEMVGLALRELARGFRMRYVPVVRYLPVQRTSMHDYAQFALEEAEATSVVEPDRVRDLATIAQQLGMAGYWTDLSSSPKLAFLIERIDRYVENATRPVDLFDPDNMLADLLPPLDQHEWIPYLGSSL